MLSAANKPITPSVFMLNVVILSVAAPHVCTKLVQSGNVVYGMTYTIPDVNHYGFDHVK